jgi:hypothetical protein
VNLYSTAAIELTHFSSIVTSIGSDLVYAGACYFCQLVRATKQIQVEVDSYPNREFYGRAFKAKEINLQNAVKPSHAEEEFVLLLITKIAKHKSRMRPFFNCRGDCDIRDHL